jgi:hypothetical protein
MLWDCYIFYIILASSQCRSWSSGWKAVWTCRYRFGTMNMEAVRSATYKSRLLYKPDDQHRLIKDTFLNKYHGKLYLLAANAITISVSKIYRQMLLCTKHAEATRENGTRWKSKEEQKMFQSMSTRFWFSLTWHWLRRVGTSELWYEMTAASLRIRTAGTQSEQGMNEIEPCVSLMDGNLVNLWQA